MWIHCKEAFPSLGGRDLNNPLLSWVVVTKGLPDPLGNETNGVQNGLQWLRETALS